MSPGLAGAMVPLQQLRENTVKTRTKKPLVALAAAFLAVSAVASPALAQRGGRPSTKGTEPIALPTPQSGRPTNDRFDPAPRAGTEAMYLVEAIEFHAADESGFDWAGSDEVYGVWRSGSTLAGTRVFGDVDTGDKRQFKDGQKCIYPIAAEGYLDGRSGDQWSCVATGGPGPIDFHIELWEADSAFTIPVCFSGGIGPEPDCEDDILGSHSVSLSLEELATEMPQVGDTMTVYRRMSSCLAGTVCGLGHLSPRYDIQYRITRMPDKEVRTELVVFQD